MSKPKKDEPDKLEDIFDLSMPDEDFDAMLRGFSGQEKLAYMQNVRLAAMKDPKAYPWATQEWLEEAERQEDIYRKAIETAEAAERKAEMSRAEFERSADRLLKVFSKTDQSKGH